MNIQNLITELENTKGIGNKTLLKIKEVVAKYKPLTEDQKVVNYFRDKIKVNLDTEENFWIILLNTSLYPTKIITLSLGSAQSATISNRRLLRELLNNNATKIILVHNHPSGTLTPSDSDIILTKGLKNVVNLLEVEIIDHIIIGKYNHYSFANNGLI